MNGIYLTQEGKQGIEAKIAALEEVKHNCKKDYEWNEAVVEQNSYRQILSSATILPVEESWGNMPIGVNESELSYPQGVIIHSKQ
jgi:hypothetical protein